MARKQAQPAQSGQAGYPALLCLHDTLGQMILGKKKFVWATSGCRQLSLHLDEGFIGSLYHLHEPVESLVACPALHDVAGPSIVRLTSGIRGTTCHSGPLAIDAQPIGSSL